MTDQLSVDLMPRMPLKYRKDAGSQMIEKMEKLIIDLKFDKRTECLKFIVDRVITQIIPDKQAKYARDLELENKISERIKAPETSPVLKWLYFIPKYFRKIWHDYKIKKLENLLSNAVKEQKEKFSTIITKWLEIDETLDQYFNIIPQKPVGVKYHIVTCLLKPECQKDYLSHENLKKKLGDNNYVCELFKKLESINMLQHSSDQEKIKCADTILQDIKSWVNQYNNLNKHGGSILSDKLKINIVNYLLMPDTVKNPHAQILTQLQEIQLKESKESIDPKAQDTLDYLKSVFTQFNQDKDKMKRYINKFIDSPKDILQNNNYTKNDSGLQIGEIDLKIFKTYKSYKTHLNQVLLKSTSGYLVPSIPA